MFRIVSFVLALSVVSTPALAEGNDYNYENMDMVKIDHKIRSVNKGRGLYSVEGGGTEDHYGGRSGNTPVYQDELKLAFFKYAEGLCHSGIIVEKITDTAMYQAAIKDLNKRTGRFDYLPTLYAEVRCVPGRKVN